MQLAESINGLSLKNHKMLSELMNYINLGAFIKFMETQKVIRVLNNRKQRPMKIKNQIGSSCGLTETSKEVFEGLEIISSNSSLMILSNLSLCSKSEKSRNSSSTYS